MSDGVPATYGGLMKPNRMSSSSRQAEEDSNFSSFPTNSLGASLISQGKKVSAHGSIYLFDVLFKSTFAFYLLLILKSSSSF